MGALPNGKRAGQKCASLLSKNENAAAAIVGIGGNLDQIAALQRLQRGSESRAVHREQRSDWSHGRRLRSIQRHQQRELPVGEFKWCEFFIKSPTKCPGGTLHMQAET